MSKTTQMSKKGGSLPDWQITADYVETCNCDFGCPCNFNGFPTYGFCRAIVLYHITRGHYKDVRLDGIPVVYVGVWPKAIHEGDGTVQLYVGKEANAKQRQAVVAIIGGTAKGNGPFALFRGTLKYFLEPKFVDVKYNINGKNSSFSVPGVLEVKVEPFKNPVTGAEAETEVHIPNGFIWSSAKACKTKAMRIVSPNITFDDTGRNAFFAQSLSFEGDLEPSEAGQR